MNYGNALIIIGYIIGLGAVTVIDLHGFLARTSPYWTRATISAHKVTKPLIWLGTILLIVGIITQDSDRLSHVFSAALPIMVINGLFLSFWVSPQLLAREKQGIADQVLPKRLQNLIAISFVVSFISWWGTLGWFVLGL
jgi:hypothetical protein